MAEIARAYLNACRESDRAPTLIGSRKLKRKTIPPFARPEALLRRDIYRRALLQGIDRFALSRLETQIRHRDEDHVARFTETTVVDWIIREVNWHPVRVIRGFAASERVPLLTKEALSHLRTELNFAYRNGIRWELVVPFIHMVGGFEIISARTALDGYPLSGEVWLPRMRDPHHPHFKAMEEARRSLRSAAGDQEDDDGWAD